MMPEQPETLGEATHARVRAQNALEYWVARRNSAAAFGDWPQVEGCEMRMAIAERELKRLQALEQEFLLAELENLAHVPAATPQHKSWASAPSAFARLADISGWDDADFLHR